MLPTATNFIESQMSLSPWIEDLPFDWSSIIRHGKEMVFKKKSLVFRQDQPADAVYVVNKGRIRLYLNSPWGDEKTFAIVGKNGLVCESNIFDKPFYNCSAEAVSDAILIKVPAAAFEDILTRDFALTKQVLHLSSHKTRLLLAQLLQLCSHSAIQRVCYCLQQLAQTYGEPGESGTVIQISFSHQEMAELVGTSRVTVAHIMKQLENESVITKANGKHCIRDRDLLHQYLTQGR